MNITLDNVIVRTLSAEANEQRFAFDGGETIRNGDCLCSIKQVISNNCDKVKMSSCCFVSFAKRYGHKYEKFAQKIEYGIGSGFNVVYGRLFGVLCSYA